MLRQLLRFCLTDFTRSGVLARKCKIEVPFAMMNLPRHLIRLWLLVAAFCVGSTAYAQKFYVLTKMPKQGDVTLPAQTANNMGGCKWQIREDRIDSVLVKNDTLQLYINRGDAKLFKCRGNRDPGHPVYGWEMPLQQFCHIGRNLSPSNQLLISNHYAMPNCTTIVLQLDWAAYIFEKRKDNRFVYVSKKQMPSPTEEEIARKQIPVQQ